jgi:uncharacterized phage protein (TIGR02218 family)
MSYRDFERSIFGGNPVELYRFTLGGTQWLYTNAADPVAYGEDTYIPIYINRNGYTRTGDTSKSSLELDVATSNPIALLFRTGCPNGVVLLTVFRHHVNDSEFSVIWKGRIIGCTWRDSSATLTSDSLFTTLRRAGLRRKYQVSCPHALYDINNGSCNVIEANYLVTATVSQVNNTTLIIPSAVNYANGYFTGGKVRYHSSVIMIVEHNADYVILVDHLTDAEPGVSVQLYPGCDRKMNTCNTKFNNVNNYGGFPFLPPKNPFSGDAIV